jgi:hypothetical protein
VPTAVQQAKYDDLSAFIERQVKLETEDAAGGGIDPFGKFGKNVAIVKANFLCSSWQLLYIETLWLAC